MKRILLLVVLVGLSVTLAGCPADNTKKGPAPGAPEAPPADKAP